MSNPENIDTNIHMPLTDFYRQGPNGLESLDLPFHQSPGGYPAITVGDLLRAVEASELSFKDRLVLVPRSNQPQPEIVGDVPVYRLADERVVIDTGGRRVYVDGRYAPMPALCLNFLSALAVQPGLVISHEEISKNYLSPRGNQLHNYGRLLAITRKSLGPELSDSRRGVIRSARGRGYVAVRSLLD